MKKLMSVVAIMLVAGGSLLSAQDRVASISPATPKVGDEIVITYDAAAKGAALRQPANLTAEVLLVRDADMPLLRELPMEKSGDVWKASFKLADNATRMLLLRFASGDKTDDNGANVWESMVYGDNGQPLQGAHLSRYSLLRFGSYVDFRHAKDLDGANAELAMERRLYPGNVTAAFTQWSAMMREKPGDETKAVIKPELERLYEANRSDEDHLAQFASWFEQLGMKEKADAIRSEAIAANPRGKVAQSVRYAQMMKENDPVKRAEAMAKFVSDFPLEGTTRESYERTLVFFYTQAKEYDKAAAVLESLPKPEGNDYNNIAWALIEKGEQLEKAVAWAKKGVDLLRHSQPSSKPLYISNRAWRSAKEEGLGMILDTYGYGLFQLGRTKEAEAAYEEGYRLMKGTDPDANQRFVDCLVKNGKYEDAISTAKECIARGKSNDKLVEAYRTAYAKVQGSDTGFEAALASVQGEAKADLKKDLLKNRVNKPALDFTLKGLDGKEVKLSGLRGKVVVVDFWATWCGPCKASFPYLQQVYNKYKDNPNVVILALDTWERVSGKERVDLVEKFMADNKYTFPVLYDEGFVEKYGVEGIPTKFVIDKKGMIQFKTIGFMGAQMVDEMTMQINMLLDDNFYISLK